MFGKNKTIISVLVLSQFFYGSIWARPTTDYEAGKVVEGWLKADPRPLETTLGNEVAQVETFTNENGQIIYYVVYLKPNGFVIVSADDLIEPIVGFAGDGVFDSSLENPLGALVTNDLNGRIAAVRDMQILKANAAMETAFECQAKWEQFKRLADGPMAMGLTSISDVRVAPLVQSKWWQWTCCSDPCLACYNYYTPPFTTPDGDPYNYVCGCVATAMSQLMRYYQYPTGGIGVYGNTVYVDNAPHYRYTRGSDGSGGPYNWDMMPYEPNCSTTEAQRQAIGALCYDAGVVLGIHYGPSASWVDTLRIKNALTTTFQYGNAVKGYNTGYDIGPGLIGMLNPNLDAKEPVILRIEPGVGAHAIVCDGYGYNLRTLYHHVNMGWGGNFDVWYNLPTIDFHPDYPPYTAVTGCIYNIHVTKVGDGEMISGRVLGPNGEPIAGASVCAKYNQQIIAETETDSKGIYAFDCLESNTTYTLNAAAKGCDFYRQEVTTGISSDYSAVSGNVWGVDLLGLLGDFDCNGVVNFKDFSKFAEYWLQNESSVDIAPPPNGDGIVDHKDLAVFAEYWLKKIPDPGQAWGPTPPDGATNQPPDVNLVWTKGATSTRRYIYFSDDYAKLNAVALWGTGTGVYRKAQSNSGDLMRYGWNPSADTSNPFRPLNNSQTYYWRIDEIESTSPKVGYLGDIWSFTTAPFIPITDDPNLVGW